MLVHETYEVEEDNGKRYIAGDSGYYEPFATGRRLFDALQREHGPCRGSVYIDGDNGEPVKVGWIFEKRVKHTNCNDAYNQNTWVTLHDREPTKTITHHYHQL